MILPPSGSFAFILLSKINISIERSNQLDKETNYSVLLEMALVWGWTISLQINFCVFFFSKLCRGKAMVAYTKPQQRKKEECKKLRGERGKVKLIDFRF